MGVAISTSPSVCLGDVCGLVECNCLWELGIVVPKKEAWEGGLFFLGSKRQGVSAAAEEAYLIVIFVEGVAVGLQRNGDGGSWVITLTLKVGFV